MQSLFSEHWHIVRYLTPKLRDNVQVLPRRLRKKNWVILHDPMTHRFVRISPQSWQVIKLMNGQRNLDLIWDIACEQTAPNSLALSFLNVNQAAISQHDLVQLLGQLYSNDLLQTQVSADADEMYERFQKQKLAKLKQSFLNPISIKIPLFYPDRWFNHYESISKVIFSRWVLFVWLVVVIPALILNLQNWDDLTNNLVDRVLSSSNLFLLWFTYPLVKAVHELAHGLAVKRWGGNVREIGLMFILFIPVPYVDASASYYFPSKWKRAMVSAAGIVAELFLGALATYVWLTVESGLIHAIAFNVILIAGVSTVLVNGNPLMRYDGYFILSDLLEIPNLAQRSTQYWTYLSDRYLFTATDAKPPIASEDERWWLITYGLISPIYRTLIMIGMIWFVAQKYFFVGVFLAILTTFLTLLLPLWKGWKHIHNGGSLARYREKAQRRLWYIILGIVLLFAVIPMPYYSLQQAVVWLPDEAIVRAQHEGHIQKSWIKAQQQLQANQPILQLDDQKLIIDWQMSKLNVEKLQDKLRQTNLEDLPQSNQIKYELEAAELKFEQITQQMQFLTPKSQISGRWIPAQHTQLEGNYVKRGDILGYVINQPAQRLRVAVTQQDLNLILSRLKGVEVRFSFDMSNTIPARVYRKVPQGQDTLVSAALGSSAGGAIPVDPSQQEGTKTLAHVFDLEILLNKPSSVVAFGDKAYVRFDLGWAPLIWQWSHKLRQLFLEKFYV